ncbi:MAG: DUF2339 domain-containing protein [Chlamydiota bacterium]|nr:DUF2339 domain-containing protein [Chlamydiota bacterium]
MQCKTCHREIPEGIIGCPNCSDDHKVERVVKEIKEEIGRSKSIMQGMLQRFNFLDERLSAIQQKIKSPKPEVQPTDPYHEHELREETHLHLQDRASAEQSAKQPVFKQEQISKDDQQIKRSLQKEPALKTHSASIQITEILFGQKALLIAGLFVTLLGLGFFLKYAMEQNWIDPLTRIISVYILASVFLVGGDRFRRKGYGAYGLCLIGGSIAMFYLATMGAYELYHIFPVRAAFILTVAITLAGALLAVYYDNKWLAVLALIGGFICPVILDILKYHNINLLRYMTILNLGLLIVGLFKRWHLLYRLGFSLTWLLFTSWYMDHYQITFFWPVLFYTNVFFLIYSIIPYLYFMFRERKESVQGIATTILNSFIAFGFNYAMIHEYAGRREVSVLTIFYAVFFLCLAYILKQKKSFHVQAYYLLLGNSLFFLTISGPLLFSKHWVTVFFCVQALSLIWVNQRNHIGLLDKTALFLLCLAFLKFYFYDYPLIFSIEIGNMFLKQGFVWVDYERWLTNGFVLCGLYYAVQYTRRKVKENSSWMGLMQFILALFSMGLFITLNVEVGSFFRTYYPKAEMASISVLWMLISIVLLVNGLRKNSKNFRVISLALMVCTLVKIFDVDIKNISTPFRILSFLFVGVVLIGASYLYYRFKDILLQKKESVE